MNLEISTPEFEKEFELCTKLNGTEIIQQTADHLNRRRILNLMIQAERYEGCWVGNDDEFGSTVVECVKTEMGMFNALYGEIDPVTEYHYLEGPNAEYIFE